MDFSDVKALLTAFDKEDVRYALVGSMAMAAQGITRATQDIDFFIDPEPENLERVKRAIRSAFQDDSIDELTESDLEYSVVRYGPPDGEIVIDLIARLGDAFVYADIEAEVIDIMGTPVRVATPRMLYLMKRDTVRLKDRQDAEAIRAKFGLTDEGH